MEKTHAVMVLDILDTYKTESNPAKAIKEYAYNNLFKMSKEEASAYGHAEEIASDIYRQGTRTGYKNGVETALEEVAELKKKLL